MNPIEAGRRAKEILTDPVFVEAMEMTKTRLTEEWKQCQSADRRETYWHLIQALDDGVVRELRTLQSRGAVALDRQEKAG